MTVKLVDDRRRIDFFGVVEVLAELLDAAGLADEVELGEDRVLELADDRGRRVELDLFDGRLEQAREIEEDIQIAADLLLDIRALYLDDHLDAVVGARSMGLSDTGCGERFLLEGRVGLVECAAQFVFDLLFDLVEAKGRHLVLEVLELLDELRRHDVRACREDLPELDEGRTEVLEHLSKARGCLAAILTEEFLGVLKRDGLRLIGKKATQAGGPGHGRKPMARQDAGDVAEAPNILNSCFDR